MAKRVLIVDDAAFMRLMIRDLMTSMSLEVVGEASNGLEAVERYKELKPDLVTMDLVMPKASGLDGLKAILDIDSNAKVVMISAVDQRESLMEAIRIGASDFIVKPFEKEHVQGVLRKILGD